MRIALIVPRFPQPSEGFIVDKVVALRRAGVDVHVVADGVDGAGLERVEEAAGINLGDRVHRTPAGTGSKPKAALAMARTPWAAVRALKRLPPGPGRTSRLAHDLPLAQLDPDLVHTEFATLAVARTHVPGWLERPLTTSIRGFDITYAGLDEPDHYGSVWPVLSGVHVLGEDLWDRARARGCPSDLPRAVIPPAIECARFSQAEVGAAVHPTDPLRMLSVGRLHWKKAHHHTLVALRGVLDAGVAARLRIVGGGPELEALAFTRHDLGLEDVVDLVGPVTRDEVRRELASAQVFVHSAVTEGFSNAVLEAQAAGLPVVCTDAEGLADNVDPDRTGIVVPRRRPHAMRAALVALARDPQRRSRMGAAGRARARMRTLDEQAAAFVEFFSDAIEAGPRPR